jgi:hypothetical protein
LRNLAQQHQPAADSTWVGHDALFGCPVARNVGFSCGTTRFTFDVRNGYQWPANFLNSSLLVLDVLPVTIHPVAILEEDRLQIARSGIGPVRRRFDGHLLVGFQQILRPSGTPQHVCRSHLAAMTFDFAVSRDFEVEPTVRIEQFHLHEFRVFEGYRLVELKGARPVMGEHGYRESEGDHGERCLSYHAGLPG